MPVGYPVSILIYLKDDEQKYDVMVTECWAYDKESFAASKHKLKLKENFYKGYLLVIIIKDELNCK